jgi:hypothetical protein
MKKLLIIAVTFLLMCMIIASCNKSNKYNATLSHADSLMNDHPDSAYAILQKVGKQNNKCDRAYYALLFSEAQYKVYIDAKSDSLINIAVDYFKNNKDREKNTRAMIYKGAIMNILGQYEEAMKWYKRAETNAAKDDYYNLGYSKMRIAELYQKQFIADTTAILKYKEAIPYFEKLNNVKYKFKCLVEIGGIYREHSNDSAYNYINKTILLAKSVNNDYFLYTSYTILSGYYYFKRQYKQAKDIAVYTIMNGGKYLDELSSYYYASDSYAMLGNKDSAEYYLKIMPKPKIPVEKVEYYDALADIERLNNNLPLYILYNDKSDSINNNIIFNSLQTKLHDIEQKYDNQGLTLKNEQMRADNNRLALLASIAVILVLITLIIIMWYRRKAKDDATRIELIKLQLDNTMQEMAMQQKKDRVLQDTIDGNIMTIKQLAINSYEWEYDSSRFMNKFRESISINKSTGFWGNLYYYVNAKYDNVLDNAKAKYPCLTERDMDVLCLLCCRLPARVIMLCMGYNNAGNVSNVKGIIAKRMGIPSLDDYIKQHAPSPDPIA